MPLPTLIFLVLGASAAIYIQYTVVPQTERGWHTGLCGCHHTCWWSCRLSCGSWHLLVLSGPALAQEGTVAGSGPRGWLIHPTHHQW